jgi:hypothetical protein
VTERETTLHWPATGLFPIKVVGARFYRNEIARITKNQAGNNALVFCAASLIPEIDNPHDENAILVMVGSERIGHLSRDFSLEFRKRLNSLDIALQATLCDAIISGGIETENRVYDYIVELDLDLSTAPQSENPTYPSIDRRDSTFVLESEGDGKYFVKVWLGEGVLGHMHKRMTIHSWTTDNWDTINYYALNSQGIGLGHKLFSVQKALHLQLFGKSSPVASFRSLNGRNAVIELAAGA